MFTLQIILVEGKTKRIEYMTWWFGECWLLLPWRWLHHICIISNTNHQLLPLSQTIPGLILSQRSLTSSWQNKQFSEWQLEPSPRVAKRCRGWKVQVQLGGSDCATYTETQRYGECFHQYSISVLLSVPQWAEISESTSTFIWRHLYWNVNTNFELESAFLMYIE